MIPLLVFLMLVPVVAYVVAYLLLRGPLEEEQPATSRHGDG